MKKILLPDTLNYIHGILDKTKNQLDNEHMLRLTNVLEAIKGIIERESESISEGAEYFLSMVAKDGRLETIADTSFSVTEIETAIFIQPLIPVTEDDFDSLQEAIQSTYVKGSSKPVILIPYDIKVLKAKAVIRMDELKNK